MRGVPAPAITLVPFAAHRALVRNCSWVLEQNRASGNPVIIYTAVAKVLLSLATSSWPWGTFAGQYVTSFPWLSLTTRPLLPGEGKPVFDTPRSPSISCSTQAPSPWVHFTLYTLWDCTLTPQPDLSTICSSLKNQIGGGGKVKKSFTGKRKGTLVVWDLQRTQGLVPASSQAPAGREMVPLHKVASGLH